LTNSPSREIGIAVDGGLLRVGVWGPDSGDVPVVLAVHGITASHLSWAPVARQLPDVRLIAPDLRGRGRSADLPGPWGMARHAEDLARVVKALDAPNVIVAGHSMGAFAAVVFNHMYPALVRRLLLVDGGLPLPLPPNLSADQLTALILGPALTRLSMTFPDRNAYREFWRRHPAFATDWNSDVEAYVDYDLVGEEPELVSCVRPEAVREDSKDQIEGAALREATSALVSLRLVFLRAPRGLQGEPPGLYPDELLGSYASVFPEMRYRTVPDVNHYTLLLSERGAAAVAGEIRALLAEQH
jgi:lipase